MTPEMLRMEFIASMKYFHDTHGTFPDSSEKLSAVKEIMNNGDYTEMGFQNFLESIVGNSYSAYLEKEIAPPKIYDKEGNVLDMRELLKRFGRDQTIHR